MPLRFPLLSGENESADPTEVDRNWEARALLGGHHDDYASRLGEVASRFPVSWPVVASTSGKPQSSLTEEIKSNRRANSFHGKSHLNPAVFGTKQPRSPPAEARSAKGIFFAAHLLCVAQQLSESQILDAGAFRDASDENFFNQLYLLRFSL